MSRANVAMNLATLLFRGKSEAPCSDHLEPPTVVAVAADAS